MARFGNVLVPHDYIEIELTGLRPAEKLYEERLIGDDVSGTQDPRILHAREHLLEGVIGYSPTEQVEDLVWRESLRKAAGGDAESPGNVTRLEPRRGPAGLEKGLR